MRVYKIYFHVPGLTNITGAEASALAEAANEADAIADAEKQLGFAHWPAFNAENQPWVCAVVRATGWTTVREADEAQRIAHLPPTLQRIVEQAGEVAS